LHQITSDMQNNNFKTAVEKLQSTGMHLKDIGELLYPSNKWPYLALNRVINGSAPITVDAAKILAKECEVSLEFILSDEWDVSVKGDTTYFRLAEFTVCLNLGAGLSQITASRPDKFSNSVTILKHSVNIKLSDYIIMITKAILKP